MPGTRLLMWDIDQTLCTTRPLGAQAMLAALRTVTGIELVLDLNLAGCTDRYTCAQALARHGITDPEPYFERFFASLEAEFMSRAHLLPDTDGPLPGVPAVLAGLAGHGHVTQTVVTGNIPAVARAKTAAFGLDRHLDFAIGGYGTEDQVRAGLVRRCRERAEAVRGQRYDEVLVIGDTPNDIEGALANGVTAVGVATGHSSVADLQAAGAHIVLESLSDTAGVVRLLAG
jgi:phosphoglycolate phosphatase-like HAD superfamily hydrolase